MSAIAEFIYRALEKLDGEKGARVIPYRIAERVKWELLKFIK